MGEATIVAATDDAVSTLSNLFDIKPFAHVLEAWGEVDERVAKEGFISAAAEAIRNGCDKAHRSYWRASGVYGVSTELFRRLHGRGPNTADDSALAELLHGKMVLSGG